MGAIQFAPETASVMSLSGLVRELYRHIEQDHGGPVPFRRLDRINQPTAQSSYADRAVHIAVPSTANTDRERGTGAAWVEDDINVYLIGKINPKDQTESQYAAWDAEEELRALLTSRAWGGRFDLVYRGTPARGSSTQSDEWHVTQQAFTARRYALLGG